MTMPAAPVVLAPSDFARTCDLALRLAGIELGERQRPLVERRAGRRGLRGADAYRALLAAAEAGDRAARRCFLGLVTVNHTGFGRHPQQLDLAAEHALYAARRRGQARLWSAAAATGEEPYSLALALHEAFAPAPPAARILATDIDEDALDRARAGVYPAAAVAGVAAAARARFLPPRADGAIAIGPALRQLVELRAHNLIDGPPTGRFDVVLCRNVLMYLTAGHRAAVIAHLRAALVADGLLLIDPCEHLGPAAAGFAAIGPGAYTLHPRVRRSP